MPMNLKFCFDLLLEAWCVTCDVGEGWGEA